MKNILLTILFVSGVWALRDFHADCITCSTKCARCSSVEKINEATHLVTVDYSQCIGRATEHGGLGWSCCRNEGCYAPLCNDIRANIGGGNACQRVVTAGYIISSADPALLLQMYDSKFIGNISCFGRGACCLQPTSSSCGTMSGVCNQIIDLTTCSYKEL